MRESIFSLVVIAICLTIIIFGSHKDEYEEIDGCLYHVKRDWNGIDTDYSRTLVTCNKEEFHKYTN